tara:strand:+ start:1588 stop:1968 length:381 start_codon:yes stop_codon:yes gene_type:complete
MKLSSIPSPVSAERPLVSVRSNSAPSVSSTSDTRPALPESIGELSVLQSLDLGNPIKPDEKIEKIEKNDINIEKNIKINILKPESYLDFLKNDTDDDVRKAVAKACGNIGDNDLARTIIQKKNKNH